MHWTFSAATFLILFMLKHMGVTTIYFGGDSHLGGTPPEKYLGEGSHLDPPNIYTMVTPLLKQQHTGILQSTTPLPELILDELFDCPTSHLDGRQCRLCSVPRAWLQPAAISVSLSSQRIPPADEAHQSSQPQCQTFCSLPCWTDPGLQFQTPPPQYYSYSPGTSSIRHTATGGEGEHWGQMIF